MPSARLAGIGEAFETFRSSTLSVGDPDLLALGVGQHQDGAFLAEEEARDELAILEGELGRAEGLVDVAVGVEDVLQQTFEAPDPHAVELGADLRPLAADLVTGRAMRLERLRPGRGVVPARGEAGASGLEELVQAEVGGGEAAPECGRSAR